MFLNVTAQSIYCMYIFRTVRLALDDQFGCPSLEDDLSCFQLYSVPVALCVELGSYFPVFKISVCASLAPLALIPLSFLLSSNLHCSY